MKVEWKDRADHQRLRALAAAEANAKQRDRYRVVLIAGEGLGDVGPEVERETIAAAVGRSRQFVDEWVGRYRRGGLEALTPKRQPGAKPKLTDQQQRELADLIDAGPLFAEAFDADDPVATPAGLAPAPETGPDPVVAAVGAALAVLAEAGVDPAARLDEVQWAGCGDQRIGVPGG